MEHSSAALGAGSSVHLVPSLIPHLVSLNLIVILVGIAVLVLALSVGVVLLSRQLAARREADLHRDLQEQRHDIERREHRLAEPEQRLDDESKRLQDEFSRLEDRAAERAVIEDERRVILERTASLTAEEAKQELVSVVERDARIQAALLARDIERSAREDAEANARRIVSTVVQRIASEQTTESTVAVVQLPGDDMKGRIIGREGRNIRAFEQITGVNVVIDDTPEAVVLSCFDPVCREV